MGARADLRIEGAPLTPREYEAIRLYAQTGLRKEVAYRMGVSMWTVRDHLWSAFCKLGADNSTEAFRKLGWLRPPR